PAELTSCANRPLGSSRRVPLVPRAGRGPRLRIRFFRSARALVVPRGRAAACGRNRPRRRRLLARRREGPPKGGPSPSNELVLVERYALALQEAPSLRVVEPERTRRAVAVLRPE